MDEETVGKLVSESVVVLAGKKVEMTLRYRLDTEMKKLQQKYDY